MLKALPVYFMSLFVAPVSVIKKLERVFRNFLWDDKDNNHKTHEVKWDVANLTKDQGGLGVKQLRSLNIALIMKWLWRFGNKKIALWRTIVAEKYGEDPFGWYTKKTKASYGCSIWRGV